MSAHLLALMLWALALVETPHGVPARPGPAGETGRWQLTPAVRHDRGAELRARGEAVTDEAIAREQLLWLARGLERRGVPVTPFNLAVAWNAGLNRYTSGKAPVRAYEFARRVENLAEESP